MKFNRKWLAGGLILAVLVVPFVVKQADAVSMRSATPASMTS